MYTPRSVDLHGLAYERPDDNSSIYYRGGNDIQHPLWTLNNVNDADKVNRFFGNVTFNYQVADWLNVSYRFGIDTYDQQQDFTQNKGGRQNPDGLFTTSDRSKRACYGQVKRYSADQPFKWQCIPNAKSGLRSTLPRKDCRGLTSAVDGIKAS